MSNHGSSTSPEPEWAAFVAFDWADQKHVWKLAVAGSAQREQGELQQTPEAVQVWACQLHERFGGRPIALAVEQRRGALVYALLQYPHLVIYPVHPSAAAHFRQALYPSGAKDDLADADMLLELLLHHRQQLRALQPDTVPTRLLQGLVEHRRRLVDEKTREKNRLTDRLKMYFPQILQWFDLDTGLALDLLQNWPTLAALQRQNPAQLAKFFRHHHSQSEQLNHERIQRIYQAVPATGDAAVVETGAFAVQSLVALLQVMASRIRKLDERIEEVAGAHPEQSLFASFPSAGPVLMPRLIVAFGTLRNHYADAAEVQSYSGIAPLTKRSGKTCNVQMRRACPRFLRQTFHEYAQHSIAKSAWAKAYYQLQRDRGKQHHAAVRALAWKWIRIMFKCWKDRVPYNEELYLEALRKRKSPIIPALAPLLDATGFRWKNDCGFSKFLADPS